MGKTPGCDVADKNDGDNIDGAEASFAANWRGEDEAVSDALWYPCNLHISLYLD